MGAVICLGEKVLWSHVSLGVLVKLDKPFLKSTWINNDKTGHDDFGKECRGGAELFVLIS